MAAASELTLLETAGFGVAISFGVVQLLTILALASASVAGNHHGGARGWMRSHPRGHLRSACAAGRRSRSTNSSCAVDADRARRVPLQPRFAGEWYEDQVHVAIVRRLSELPVAAARQHLLRARNRLHLSLSRARITSWRSSRGSATSIRCSFIRSCAFSGVRLRCVMLYLLARAAFGSVAVACADRGDGCRARLQRSHSAWCPDFRRGGDSSFPSATRPTSP